MTAPSTREEALGLAYQAAGAKDWPRVEALAREIMTRFGADGDAFQLLGFIALETGKPDLALDLFRRAGRADASRVDFQFHAALAAHRHGELTLAASFILASLKIQPDYPPALRLGAELAASHDAPEGMAIIEQALSALPDSADILCWAVEAACRRNQFGLVPGYLSRAIKLSEGDLAGLVRIGNLAMRCWQPPLAYEAYKAAAALPHAGDVELGGVGTALHLMGRPGDALVQTEAGLKNFPQSKGLAWNRALFLLASGQIAKGWDAFEGRFSFAPETCWPRFAHLPAWNGKAGAGRLVIWHEQGVGDELIFATVYRELRSWPGPVTVICDGRLVDLFSRSFPGIEFMADHGDAVPGLEDATAGLSAGSLPRLFRRDLAAFPATARSFIPDAKRMDQMRSILQAWGPRPKIGLCWRGLTSGPVRGPFYSDVSDWLPLLRDDRFDVVALQYGLTDQERAFISSAGGRLLEVRGLDLKDDFDGVAALDGCLDAIVAVDTAAAPLAAGVGTACYWLTLPTRWAMLGTGEHPWFRSSKTLIRQPGEGWATVVRQVINGLEARLPAHR